MIPQTVFLEAVQQMGYDLDELRPIIEPGAGTSMQIIAGAGTGKTTALTFKCLHGVFVEGLPPETIVATTFTKKAAREFQSRILDEGQNFLRALEGRVDRAELARLGRIDLNKILTGTLDSILQEVLNEYKVAGNPPPIPIEPFVARGIMVKVALHRDGRHRSQELAAYLCHLKSSRQPPRIQVEGGGRQIWLPVREKAKILYDLRSFLIVADVDREAYLAATGRHPGARIALQAIQDFEQNMASRGIGDYTTIARLFLTRLENGDLDEFARSIRLILVDEYQDTEYLQERIYFGLALRVLENNGALVVVGDDDQALYRFRGATVGLFTQFRQRLHDWMHAHSGGRFDITPLRRTLVINRRSTHEIITYCQSYLVNDPAYARARSDKPPLVPPENTKPSGVPVYLLHADGDDAAQLAARVADVVARVMDTGWQPAVLGAESIAKDSTAGCPSDIAIITASAKEMKRNQRTNQDEPLFLGHLRQLLPARAGIELFNPRGRSLGDVPEVAYLLGTLLLCFDPRGTIAPDLGLTRDVQNELLRWRNEAANFVATNPSAPGSPGKTLGEYVASVATARALPDGDEDVVRRLGVAEVLYRIVTWIGFFQDDIEGLAYLEVLQRTISQAKHLGRYQAYVEYDQNGHIQDSVEELIWNILVPLATDEPELDEELLVTLPPDRVPVLTVHQAKGLEFPMVIVDAGSSVRDGHAFAPTRFPANEEDMPNRLITEFRNYAGYVDTTRSLVDQRFDDLVRKHFVAASRAKQALLLITHSGGLRQRTPNVAMWWRRDRSQADRMPHMVTLP